MSSTTSARPAAPGATAGACIALGADHGGFALKEHLEAWLVGQGFEVHDCGTHDTAPVDYPDVAARVALMVSQGECGRGIIVDGAGIGSSMVANKFPGVRAALCYDLSSARNSREHNDANVLTLGARLIGEGLAEQIVSTFLSTECSEERHLRRVAMIGAIGSEAVKCEACAPRPAGSVGAAPAGYWEGASLADARRSGPNFALAGSGTNNDNAAPDARAAAFRASAAKWLSMDATKNDAAPGLSDMGPADLERVVVRIAELMGSGQLRAGMWCFGDVCVDAHVAREWIGAGVARLSNGLGGPVASDVASYIDHTLLRPDATRAEIEQLCAEAAEHRFASVCVNPYWVPLAAKRLGNTPVLVCTVVGFPLGASAAELKAMEARRAIREGAREIDMVINIGALKSGDDATVYKDIRLVVEACEDGRAICKVIIETALLGDEEKVRACVAAKKARADFVKTSTGFASGGATAEDVALMSRVVSGAGMGVKASGGVKTYADLDRMVRAGATRIGASAGVKIIKEAAVG